MFLTLFLPARFKSLGLPLQERKFVHTDMHTGEKVNLANLLDRVGDIIDFEYPAWHTLGDTSDTCPARSLGMSGSPGASIAFPGLS